MACRIDDHPTRSDPVALSRRSDIELVACYQAGSDDALVRIPLRGSLGSLNVAAAGALACFEVARARR